MTNPRPNPYVGPRSFQTNETIYGRERELRFLLAQLVSERIVLLHSPSGAGKTSLIQAGLIPQLRREKFHVLPVARVNLEPDEDVATQAEFNRYAFSVMLSLEESLPVEQRQPVAALANLTLDAYLTARPRPADAPRSDLLIFDQFEEILTTDPTNRDEKQAFFAQLGVALRNSTRWALFAIREDYLGAMAPFVRPIPNRFEATYRLDLLGERAALDAIQHPSNTAGVVFPDEVARKLVDDLRQVQTQRPDGGLETSLGQHIEPVQLQVVCYRLWQTLGAETNSINQDDLSSVGNVDQSLAEYYALSVAQVARESGISERDLRAWFETRLITREGIRGQVLLGEGLPVSVSRQLENTHLIRAEKRAGATWYELAHDRLVGPVRQDNASWYEQNLNTLQRQATLWSEQNRAEGFLLKGNEFKEAWDWAKVHRTEISETERTFLKECRKVEAQAQEKVRASRRTTLAMIVEAVVLVGVLLAFGIKFYQDSQQATANRLIAASEKALIAGDKVSAAAYAYQALTTYNVGEAEQALANVVSPMEKPNSFDVSFGKVINSAFSDDGRTVEAINQNGSILKWEAETGKEINFIRHSLITTRAVFSPDGNRVAVWDYSGNSQVVYLYNIVDGEQLMRFELSSNSTTGVSFNSDNTLLAVADSEKSIQIWNLETKEMIFRHVSIDNIGTFELSPDGRRLLINSKLLLDTLTGKEIRSLESSDGKFSPDGQFWALSIPVFQVVDVSGKILIDTDQPVDSFTFSPDGAQIVTINKTDAFIWEVAKGKKLVRLEDFSSCDTISFALDNNRIWCWKSGNLDLWDAKTGTFLTQIQTHSYTNPIFNPDGTRLILSAKSSGTPQIVDIKTGRLYPAPESRHLGLIANFAISPDDATLVTATDDGTLRFWNVKTGDSLGAIVNTGQLSSSAYSIGTYINLSAQNVLAFSSDGQQIAVNSDKDVWDWDIKTKQVIFKLTGHTEPITSVAFSPDGLSIATASSDKTVRIWDASTGKEHLIMTGHTKRVNSVAFSPDGKRIATASDDETVRIWDTQTGQELLKYTGQHSQAKSAAFSSDNLLVTGCWWRGGGNWNSFMGLDPTVYIWNSSSGKEVSKFMLKNRGNWWMNTAVFSPDGARILANALYDDNKMETHLWDVSKHDEILILTGHSLFLHKGNALVNINPLRQAMLYPLWPSRITLLDLARHTCGACELTYEQRVNLNIHSIPMLLFDYRTELSAVWVFLFYCTYGFWVYRAVFVISATSNNPDEKTNIHWKAFVYAGLGGCLLISIWLTGVIMFFVAETILEAVANTSINLLRISNSDANTLLGIVFLGLPLATWTGVAYSNATRLQTGTRALRVWFSMLSGLVAGFFIFPISVLSVALFISAPLVSDLSNNLATSLKALGILAIFCIPGALFLFFLAHSKVQELPRGKLVLYSALAGWALSLPSVITVVFVSPSSWLTLNVETLVDRPDTLILAGLLAIPCIIGTWLNSYFVRSKAVSWQIRVRSILLSSMSVFILSVSVFSTIYIISSKIKLPELPSQLSIIVNAIAFASVLMVIPALLGSLAYILFRIGAEKRIRQVIIVALSVFFSMGLSVVLTYFMYGSYWKDFYLLMTILGGAMAVLSAIGSLLYIFGLRPLALRLDHQRAEQNEI